MRPKQPTLKFSDKEFFPNDENETSPNLTTNPKKVAAFVMLFGKSKWNKLQNQFADQRILPEKIAGMTHEELDNLSQDEYEARRDEIQKDMQLPDPNKPVFGEIEAPDLDLKGLEGQRMFIENFGEERFFQAKGVNPDLSQQSYHRIKGRNYTPYKKINNG